MPSLNAIHVLHNKRHAFSRAATAIKSTRASSPAQSGNRPKPVRTLAPERYSSTTLPLPLRLSLAKDRGWLSVLLSGDRSGMLVQCAVNFALTGRPRPQKMQAAGPSIRRSLAPQLTLLLALTFHQIFPLRFAHSFPPCAHNNVMAEDPVLWSTTEFLRFMPRSFLSRLTTTDVIGAQ